MTELMSLTTLSEDSYRLIVNWKTAVVFLINANSGTTVWKAALEIARDKLSNYVILVDQIEKKLVVFQHEFSCEQLALNLEDGVPKWLWQEGFDRKWKVTVKREGEMEEIFIGANGCFEKYAPGSAFLRESRSDFVNADAEDWDDEDDDECYLDDVDGDDGIDDDEEDEDYMELEIECDEDDEEDEEDEEADSPPKKSGWRAWFG